VSSVRRAFVLAAAAWSGRAAAQGAPPAPTVADDDPALAAAAAETIEIYDERPDKPFDRDTEVRLTGEQLAARGAVDLATALALLPDVTVRDAGRGGFNVDIRGARKGAVSVLVDGVVVTDPYYGTFDVSTIPITDIVQIRVSTTPQSPIDGPGGPGGVIEVHTRDAIGTQLVIARTTASSLPAFLASATGRIGLVRHLALRLSASGVGGSEDFDLPSGSTLDEQRRAATGASRLEYRDKQLRVVFDGFLDSRHYISPPSDEDATAAILLIDRETTERASLKADLQRDKLQLEGQAYVHHLYRRSRYYSDPALMTEAALEDLTATRIGALALATHPIGKEARWAASAAVDFDAIDVHDMIGNSVTSSLTLTELAVDGQYEHETVRVDAAAGLAIPFVSGGGADPWPEGKLVVKYRPNFGPLELAATAARKGRVPSLRERFDPATGNPALGPEMIDHLELRAIEQIDRLRLEVAPFYKHSTGTVRADLTSGKLVNLGILNYYGVDVIARVRAERRVELGGAYDFVKVTDDALDRLPHHRWEGWVQATPERRLSLLARVRYFGHSLDKGNSVSGYTLVEASATSPITKQYLAVLRCDDLLDKRPETRAGYHSAGRTIYLVLQGSWE
jgi:outer membrane receptor protein involved in Fe transport